MPAAAPMPTGVSAAVSSIWHSIRIGYPIDRLSPRQDEDKAMYDIFDQAGFQESVLNSYDDFEPYGYGAPHLMPALSSHTTPRGQSVRDRVIEAEILNQSTMVGC
jgi:hypothetical protein